MAYLTLHISHTYPAHHTYPTHIHSKRIPPIRIPPVRIHAMRIHSKGCKTYRFKRFASAGFVIRIPPITTHIPYISSTSHISHTCPFQTYPIPNVSHQYVSPPIRIRSTTRIPPIRIHAMRIHSKVVHQQESQTYPTNTYPTNTNLQHVSHQYGSIECVSIQKACISRNGNEYEHHCIIAYPFIPLLLGGNCNEYRNLAYPSISLQYY